jgi:hypothetical protein
MNSHVPLSPPTTIIMDHQHGEMRVIKESIIFDDENTVIEENEFYEEFLHIDKCYHRGRLSNIVVSFHSCVKDENRKYLLDKLLCLKPTLLQLRFQIPVHESSITDRFHHGGYSYDRPQNVEIKYYDRNRKLWVLLTFHHILFCDISFRFFDTPLQLGF